MSRGRGLTVLELLVVVLIIMLLVALLLPVISASRNRARTTVCMSNMRQLVSALLMYRQDNGRSRPLPNMFSPTQRAERFFVVLLTMQ